MMTKNEWTVDDIGDQTGRIAVITGANRGIGFFTALGLARKGANVVLACRDWAMAVAASGRIRSLVPLASVQIAMLDLGDLVSVRAFAKEVVENTPRVDLLVNNAGVMAAPLSYTVDGFESQFGINHLGHFALTGLLLDHLESAPCPRVVTVSSMAHHRGRIDFDNLDASLGYHRVGAYSQSKLANLLFSAELARRASKQGSKVRSAAAHPAIAGTNLLSAGPMADLPKPVRNGLNWAAEQVLPPPVRGAMPVLYAATSPGVANGDYFGPPTHTMGYWGAPCRQEVAPAALDAVVAKHLWTVSEELTGVRYL